MAGLYTSHCYPFFRILRHGLFSFAVTQNKNKRQNEKVYDEINPIGKLFVYYNLLLNCDSIAQ